MKEKIYSKIADFKNLVLLFIALLTCFTIFAYLIIETNSSDVYKVEDPNLAEISQDISIGIVFGGGVDGKEPTKLIQDRLDTAKTLLDKGYVSSLILSGDNRFLEYNEPTAMRDYLLKKGVDQARLYEDFAGRSTYETCERANKIFGVEGALLISESTHLPRAIYLCRHFGITSYGVESDGNVAKSLRIPQQIREVIARNKAVFNIYIYGEKTVLGNPIPID